MLFYWQGVHEKISLLVGSKNSLKHSLWLPTSWESSQLKAVAFSKSKTLLTIKKKKKEEAMLVIIILKGTNC